MGFGTLHLENDVNFPAMNQQPTHTASLHLQNEKGFIVTGAEVTVSGSIFRVKEYATHETEMKQAARYNIVTCSVCDYKRGLNW
jgi:hypothetical protein